MACDAVAVHGQDGRGHAVKPRATPAGSPDMPLYVAWSSEGLGRRRGDSCVPCVSAEEVTMVFLVFQAYPMVLEYRPRIDFG